MVDVVEVVVVALVMVAVVVVVVIVVIVVIVVVVMEWCVFLYRSFMVDPLSYCRQNMFVFKLKLIIRLNCLR